MAHRELARSNAQLRWLSEQKNQLLGMAAHDLRNPLAAVLAYTSFLLEDPLTADQSGMVKRIRANVDTMLAMVEDVLDFTAIESGTVRLDRADLAVESIISDVVEVCGMVAARKEIRIAATVAPETPTVFADRRKITQVLTNLVTNAIKFSHPQSHITVAAGTTEDRGVWISVTDHGVGMTAEQVKKLFQPFEQVGTRPTAGEKSTGLGLAIVGRIVAAHDGRINVESAPGKGSTFTVVLPAAAVREEVLRRVSSEQ